MPGIVIRLSLKALSMRFFQCSVPAALEFSLHGDTNKGAPCFAALCNHPVNSRQEFVINSHLHDFHV